MQYDPYMGYAPAGAAPNYFNPYTNYTGQNNQKVPGQQAGQAIVPGKDQKTPNMAKKPSNVSEQPVAGWAQMQSPTGTIRFVHPNAAQQFERKGARRIG